MSLRSLADLGSTAAGRELLAEHGVLSQPDRFRAVLRPPVRPGLAERFGLSHDHPLVYVGQQVATDYAHATAAKFVTARELDEGGVRCVMIWHDMDRAGSGRYGLRIVINLAGSPVGFGLASRKFEDRESRFVRLERERLPEAFSSARDAVGVLPRATQARAREKLDAMELLLADESITTLAEATQVLATWLLREQLGVDLGAIRISDLVAAGLLQPAIVEVLERRDEVVDAFNSAVAGFERHGIDPHVHPLDDQWLPLWYSCLVTGRRLRLRSERSGAVVLAVAPDCPCGERHRFDLGSGASLDELEATGRWSPDVLLPVFHNELTSGYVAGRSTALYGAVMREVIRALGREPTPALVPAALTEAGAGGLRFETLLNEYLAA